MRIGRSLTGKSTIAKCAPFTIWKIEKRFTLLRCSTSIENQSSVECFIPTLILLEVKWRTATLFKSNMFTIQRVCHCYRAGLWIVSPVVCQYNNENYHLSFSFCFLVPMLVKKIKSKRASTAHNSESYTHMQSRSLENDVRNSLTCRSEQMIEDIQRKKNRRSARKIHCHIFCWVSQSQSMNFSSLQLSFLPIVSGYNFFF